MAADLTQKAFTEIVSMDDVLNLSPAEFESFTEHLLTAKGYTDIFQSPKMGRNRTDGGVDIYAKYNGRKVIVQCKRWRKEKAYMPIGELRKLAGIVRDNKAVESVFISTLPFSKESKKFAFKNDMTLIGPEEIAMEMTKLYPAFRKETNRRSRALSQLKKDWRQYCRHNLIPALKIFGVLVVLLLLFRVFPGLPEILAKIVTAPMILALKMMPPLQ